MCFCPTSKYRTSWESLASHILVYSWLLRLNLWSAKKLLACCSGNIATSAEWAPPYPSAKCSVSSASRRPPVLMETLSKGLSARFRSAIKSSTSTDTWNKNCFASQAISLSLTSSISTACIGTKRERDSFHVSLRPLSTTGGRRKERGRRKEQRGSELAEEAGSREEEARKKCVRQRF